MESTGVYWIPIYEILEQRGMTVCLVNAQATKNVSGRKTDALDCKMKAADFKSKLSSGGAPSFGPIGMAKHKKEMNEATEEANKFYVECMEEKGYSVK